MLGPDFRGQGYKFAAWFPVLKCLLTRFLVGNPSEPWLSHLDCWGGGMEAVLLPWQFAGRLNEPVCEGPLVH